MSREPRRPKGNVQPPRGVAPPSRRTPVKVEGGSRLPVLGIGIAGGVLLVVGLLAYLVLQSNSSGSSLVGYEKAEADSSASVPGTYVQSQGRGHYAGGYTTSRPPTPFCAGVAWSGADSSAAASPTPTVAATTAPVRPGATPTVPANCYNSNPPSSGKHLNVQNNVDVGGGNVIKIPPDPDIYPSNVEIPRDAVAHILEHAGVFLGYNCASNDLECDRVVQDITKLATDRLENGGDRIVMAHDSDLVPGTIGMSSWTRVLIFKYQDYDAKEVQRFMDKNSCRYDPEGFCRG